MKPPTESTNPGLAAQIQAQALYFLLTPHTVFWYLQIPLKTENTDEYLAQLVVQETVRTTLGCCLVWGGVEDDSHPLQPL